MKNIIINNLIDLPTNNSLNYWWCSGFMIFSFLFIQIITGIILSFLYVADESLSFYCVMNLSNDSLFTWFIRYFHIWGVTFIFLIFIIHIGRGLYYSSYLKISVWNTGFFLYILMMVEAFLGYILPWHQMSYWAATVLTSVIQSVPLIGNLMYSYIVGGFSVTNVTLVRMFSGHLILAFVIIGSAILHMFFLHKVGSNNSLFISSGYSDFNYFHSYYTVKDLFSILSFLCFFIFLLGFYPDLVLEVESYLAADSLVTPSSIKPEWYFLFYYAMLRSIPSKIGGLILVIIFLILLWVPYTSNSCVYNNIRQILFWVISSNLLLLSYFGFCVPEEPFITISFLSSIFLIFCLFIFKFFNILASIVNKINI
uniref:Cytochrome b n=1 Tax=Paratetraonchoides inermis TaxID=2048240 RepID=A0A2D1GRS5_9PLAT|nr:cytochrome b [Paratetraonchoides inermis]ATN95410.1 cytochrome b [Paratetraonchoides inermis]